MRPVDFFAFCLSVRHDIGARVSGRTLVRISAGVSGPGLDAIRGGFEHSILRALREGR